MREKIRRTVFLRHAYWPRNMKNNIEQSWKKSFTFFTWNQSFITLSKQNQNQEVISEVKTFIKENFFFVKLQKGKFSAEN